MASATREFAIISWKASLLTKMAGLPSVIWKSKTLEDAICAGGILSMANMGL